MMEYESYKKDVLTSLTKAERDALKEVGFYVQAEAMLRTPIDTGALKRSIINKLNEGERSVSIGSNLEYSSYVELGTSKTKAQPFLKPAVEDNISKIKAIIEEHIKDDLG